jgi:hypothetical protein
LELVQSFSPGALLRNEPRVSQHPQVLRNSGTTLLEVGGQIVHGHGTAAQAIQDRAPRRIRDGPEDVLISACSMHNR